MAAPPDGNIMDGSVYAVPKTNKKLGGDFDQFERDHEPLNQVREYEQQYHIARYKLSENLKKLEALEGVETFSAIEKLKPELESRIAKITEVQGLRATAEKGLHKLKQLSTKADQESADMRKKISDHVASVFPAVKEELIKIEAHVSGEVTRLTRENGQLHRENATLITAAGNANIMDEMRNFVADELKRAEATSRQDTEEVSRLKGVVNYLESQMGTVQVELQKAREEVVTAEQQLTDAKLAWEEEKVELRGSVDLWKNVAADKDDTIRKLEKKIQKMDMEFEWVKGRSLEYYGSLQIANQDNKTLQGGIDELCKALDEMKAEMQTRAAEDIARDEAIVQMVQATKVLDSMRTSRPTSVASVMDWESELSRSASRIGQSLDPFSASRQSSPVRRTESSRCQSASKRRSSMGSQMNEDSSTALPNVSEAPIPGELTPAGRGQMMTPGGFGPRNSGDFSDQSLRNSTYTSPYLRGPSPSMPGGNITTGIGSLGIGGFQVPGTPRSQLTINAGTVGRGALGQPPESVGTFGQGSSTQSSPTAGTFGPALAQPVTPQYTFLVSGDLATGPRTSTVDPSTTLKMNAQIARWRVKSHVNWAGSSAVSHKRCSETRVQQFKKAKNPPASENPNVACAHCVANKILCVLVGKNGPVVVPLPVSERSPGATPTNGEYYIKA